MNLLFFVFHFSFLSMYIYSFTKFGGFDKVFRLPKDFLGTEEKAPSKKKGPQMGDLIKVGEDMYLVLGENISFEELYLNSVILSRAPITMVYSKFLSKQAMQLLHWMVETYYTTYKSVVKHFITDELEKLLERENKLSKAAKGSHPEQREGYNYILRSTQNDNDEKDGFTLAEKGQTLIVFPDLWTMTNQLGTIETMQQGNNVTLLASQTEKQKAEHRWEIKKGSKSVILCTYGELFQDFHDLQKIIRIDPHKWYYANQQDPRYKVGEVLRKMAALSGAELEEVGV